MSIMAESQPDHRCLSMIVHTVLALMCFSDGGRHIGQCDITQPLDRVVLALVCVWYGYELRGFVRDGVSMMAAHHACTIALCLTAFATQLECSGFLTYRATVLAEPIVDAFLLLRGSGHIMELPVSVAFTITFVWTRGVAFLKDVTLPVLRFVAPAQPPQTMAAIMLMAVGMQCMQFVWCWRVLSGAAKLLGMGAKRTAHYD